MLKNAIVLPGGGSRGAFQLGVLKCLLHDLETRYDIIKGISVGALNGSFLAQFPHGKEKESWIELEKLWDNIKENSDIYQLWYYGILWKVPALWKQSMYNSKALQKMIRKNLDIQKLRSSKKELGVGAISVQSGLYKEFTQNDDSIIEGVIASSAMPALLEGARIDGDLWIDGGVQNVVPLDAAIEAGADNIDIILTGPGNPRPFNKKNPNAISVAYRAIDLEGDEIVKNDLVQIAKTMVAAKTAVRKKIKYRVFKPEYHMIKDSLDFNPKKQEEMKQHGYEVARKKLL